jgi:ribosomal protein S18 acetylase RimI-like enzyme
VAGIGVSELAAEEIPPAILLLAAAFRDNPLNVAVIAGDAQRRLRCNEAGMRQLVPVARERALVLAARRDGVRGVLIATPPHGYPLPPPSPTIQLRTLWTQGLRVRLRWGRVFEHLDRLHPLEPHWYLATLGVHPEWQGRGIGRELLAALLRRSDAEHGECYLETDREQNLPFYEAAGFRVAHESRVLGVSIWHMRREPA